MDEKGPGVLAIDGKTLRRSFDKAAGGSALHVASAIASGRHLVLGQAAVAKGGNEIVAARKLLALLYRTGLLVTGDAIHCQNDTCTLIAQTGRDWLFAHKTNRPAMYADLEAFFCHPDRDLGEAHGTTDADHGPAGDPPPLEERGCQLAILGSTPKGQAATARVENAVPRPSLGDPRRQNKPQLPLLCVLRRSHGVTFCRGCTRLSVN